MNKILKYTGYIFAGLVSFLIVAVIILKLIPDSQYNNWITSATQSATGRDFSIGTLELDFGTALRVRADKVKLANADWAKQDDMLLIEHLEADFGLLALFAGKADIRAVTEQAEVLAEKNADGISNWAMDTEKPAEEPEKLEVDQDDFSGLPLHPVIREIRIDNFTLTLVKEPGAIAKVTHLKQLLIETPEKDTTLTLSANANGHPIEISGNLGNMKNFLDQASEPVSLKVDIDGNLLNLSGNWGPLFPKQTMNVDVDLKIPATADLAEAVGLDIEEFEDILITGKILGDGNKLALDTFEINLDDANGELRIKGSIADLTNMEGINITTDANTASLGTLLQQLHIELPVPLPPVIEIDAEINGGLEELALSELVIVAKDEGVDIKATASIADLLKAKKITGKVTGTIDSLSALSKYAQMDLPSLGKLELSADLASNEKALQLNNLDVKLDSDNINVEVTGKVADLLTVSGIDALAKADIRSFSEQNITELTQFLKQFDVKFPVERLPQSINLSTGIQGSLEQLSLVDVQGEVLDEGVKVGLDGAVENVLVPSGVKANLSLDSDSIANLSKYAGSELPQTDPLNVLIALTEDASKHPNFTLHAETGGANIDINGALESLALPEEIELGIAVKAKSVSDFNQLAQKELPEQGPLDLTAKLKLQLQKNNYAVNDLKLLLGDQSALGNLAITLPGNESQPTVINGKLDIPFLDLSFLMPEVKEIPVEANAPVAKAEPAEADDPTAESEPSKASTTEAAKTEVAKFEAETSEGDSNKPQATTDRLFSSEPFLHEQLHNYEIDLVINGSKIKLGKADMKDVELVVTLKDGLFSADPIKGTGGAGNMNGFIRIDGRSEVPELKVDLGITGVPMPNLGGKLDFDADLVGKGKSVAELMGSLNGQMLVVMRDGKIEGPLIQKFGSGLLSFAKDKGYTELECGILRVDIKDGIANFDKRLAAQLTEVTWRGGGEVNLKTEQLGIGIAPKPRKGIPISISGELSSLIYVGGTLKHPKMQLNPKDVAVKYAKYSAYVASGGLTYLAEVIKDKIDANRDVCELILDGTVFEEMDKEDEKAEKKAQKAAEKAEK